MERLIQIVTMELALDRLKAEAEMERIINDNVLTTEAKVPLIKAQLSKLADHNHMAAAWLSYTNVLTEPETNNNNS